MTERGSRRQRRPHRLEVCVVEEVERLRAELQVHRFSDSSILQQRHIVAPEPWAVNGAPAFVPRSPAHSHRSKSGSVEELSEGLRPVVWVTDLIGPRRGNAAVVRSA